MYLNVQKLDKRLENKEFLFELFDGFSILDRDEHSILYTLSSESKAENKNQVHIVFLGTEFDKWGADIGLNLSDTLSEVSKIINLPMYYYDIQSIIGGYKGQLEQSLMITFNDNILPLTISIIIERLRVYFRQDSVLYIDSDSKAHFITE